MTAPQSAQRTAQPTPSNPAASAATEASGPATEVHEIVTISMIGVGNMGGAIAQGLIAAGVDPQHLVVVGSTPESTERVAAKFGARAGTAAEAAACDAVILGVKPAGVVPLLESIAPSLGAESIVVSLAAGVSLKKMEHVAPTAHIVRAMPNTPVLVRRGATALSAGRHVTAAHMTAIKHLLEPTGLVIEVAEKDMDAVVAVSGSGPAYIFHMIDAMAEAGVRLGLTRQVALDLAVATVEGAGTQLRETGMHPALAREMVTSPGGTTAQALAVLDRQVFRGIVGDAMEAAAQRSHELGKN
ncbi:pyrroline-5-carboxylate reductase [Micrococcales bacterium 31B]|nr:pyrroline-5-carboxylate reductase [Micrococcales bacterium 31B]